MYPNHFLNSLSPADRDRVLAVLKPIELSPGAVLFKPEERINRVYFPHTGAISLLIGLSDGRFVEAGIFGRNCAVGAGAALDGAVAIHHAVSQIGGSGAYITVEAVKQMVAISVPLREAFAAQEQMVVAHIQQVAACNATHSVEERLSRWLLQTRDIVGSDELPLTQDLMSQMLGVQRSTLTLAARRLQEAGLIRYRRGRIRIEDAEALEDTSCECYGAILGHFDRLTGWKPGQQI